MDNMSNNNEFTNSFPISDNEKPINIEKDAKNTKYLSVLNVGQIVVLIILCVVICLQAVQLLSYQNQSAIIEPLQIGADYGQPNTYEVSTKNNSVEDTGIPVGYYFTDAIDANKINGATTDNLLETTPSEPEVIFILGESEGRLAILSADGQIVYETFNVHINTLPPLDRDMLREGIRITTTEELSSLLEDFSS